ncbi:MAG TPA: DUF5652 family protein [Candidatus Paceibacterota bacterium]
MDTSIINEALNGIPLWLIIIVTLWSLVWKGIALWKTARLSQKKWFIVLFLVNTLGILDIIYIRFIAEKYTVETVEK